MEKCLQIPLKYGAIPCKLTEPEGIPVRRVILGVHGLGGSVDDEIQSSIAEEMGMFGAAVLRFDFPAHGAHPVQELTLHGCVDTLLGAAAYAKERYPQTEQLCIFATGFGAYVVLTCLPELQLLSGSVRLVIQTPAVRMDHTLLRMIRKTPATVRAEDRFTIPTPRPFDVTYDFYRELRENVVLDSYDIPILILQGENDAYINHEDIQSFRRINERSRLVIIPGASHRFLEEGAWDMVLDLTRDWFEYEQVLLCDCI